MKIIKEKESIKEALSPEVEELQSLIQAFNYFDLKIKTKGLEAFEHNITREVLCAGVNITFYGEENAYVSLDISRGRLVKKLKGFIYTLGNIEIEVKLS